MAKLNITFVDEKGTNLNRYTAIDVNTGAEYVFDLSRNGTITIPGTPLNAEIMNAIIEAINSIDLVNNVIQQKVLCPHRYEITGDTGNEHGLAIEDQQMLLDRIQGRTLVKNQFVNGNGSFYITGNEINIPVNIYNDIISGSATRLTTPIPIGSKVLCIATFSQGQFDGGGTLAFGGYHTGAGWQGEIEIPQNINLSGKTFYKFHTTTNTVTDIWSFLYAILNVTTQIKGYINYINLTLMYGAGNEPTTIEEVLNDFNGYEEYDEGSFIHSKNNLISTGRNLLNVKFKQYLTHTVVQITDNIKVLKNTTYVFKVFGDLSKYSNLYAQGVNTNSNLGMTIVANTNNVVTFNTGENTEIYLQVNNSGSTIDQTIPLLNANAVLSYESELEEYEPYQEDVMVVNEELKALEYIDNITNEKVNNGMFVDLGDYTYSRIVSYTNPFFCISISNLKVNAKALCSKYTKITNVSETNFGQNAPDKSFAISTQTNQLFIRDDSYTDVATFKASLQGVMLYYETTTETRELLQLPRGMAVAKYGLQIQQGTIPYLLTKTYSLNIGAQVKANIAIDKEQQAQINELKNQNKTKVFEIINSSFDGSIGQTSIRLPNTFLELVNRYDELNFQFVVENENQLDINNYTISTYFVKKMIIHGIPIRYLMGNVYVQFGANGETDIENSYTIVFEHKDGKEIVDGEITGIR